MKAPSRTHHNLSSLALTVLFGLALLAATAPPPAAATTAANAVITNTATVNYDDAGGNPQAPVPASVSVTVNLVTATPGLSDPGDWTGASGTVVDMTYTITTSANGPDTYALTANAPVLAGGATGAAQAFLDMALNPIANITLGATSVFTGVTILAAGPTAVIVPNDGVADGIINGLVVGDTVVVNGAVHTVNAITADPISGTATLTLNGNGVANSVTTGMLIAERVTFISRVTPVGTGGTATVTINANDGVSAAASDATIYNITAIGLTVTKYVANLTTPMVGGGSVLNKGGVSYYTTLVNGLPGQTLEYVIAIENAALAAQATNVVISDPVPDFTNYAATFMQVDPNGTGWVAVTENPADSDKGEYDPTAGTGGTVYIYAGTGGDDGGVAATYNDGTGGTLNGGVTTYGSFRVTIQP